MHAIRTCSISITKAYLEYANGNYTEAYKLFEAIDRTGELGYQSQYYMCQILYKQGDYNNAARLGASLIEDNQNDYFSSEMRVLEVSSGMPGPIVVETEPLIM